MIEERVSGLGLNLGIKQECVMAPLLFFIIFDRVRREVEEVTKVEQQV